MKRIESDKEAEIPELKEKEVVTKARYVYSQEPKKMPEHTAY
jgi:hypothetical protein